jgi:hypothetical protein
MAIILRTQREQERIEGRPLAIDWRADDYAVLDDETLIGRIYKEQIPAGVKWCWFLHIAGAQVRGDGFWARSELIDKLRVPEMMQIACLESGSGHPLVITAVIVVVGSVQRLVHEKSFG